MSSQDDIIRKVATKREEIRKKRQQLGDAGHDPARLEKVKGELTQLKRELARLVNDPDYNQR